MLTSGGTISISKASPPHAGPAQKNRGPRRWVLNSAGRLLGEHFIRDLREMEMAQWLEPEQLKARTEQKLAPLLAHAAQHVPFYRDYYRKHGIEPERLQTVEDLRGLPVLTKSEYREQGIDQFLADNIPEHRRLERATSGSSGEPFRFLIDRDATPVIFASHLFYDSWFGFQPFDRYIRIVSPPPTTRAISRSAPLAFRYRQMLTTKLQT
jgi:phenylacetate-CoA ligase